jgi:putative ABC transport system permease protein
VFRLFDSLRFALERLWQHRMLVMWALVGLSAATTLALSVMLYVDAVNTRLLASRLTDPPYAFRFRYLGSWNGNISRADVETADAAITDHFVDVIGLPASRVVRYRSGGAWTASLPGKGALGAFNLGTLIGADEQITIVSGEWPAAPPAEGDPLPVLVSQTAVYGMGLSVGDTVTVTRPGGKSISLRIAAMWKPTNASDPSWLFPPKFFDNVMLIDPDALWSTLDGIERPVEETAWYILFNGATVRTSDIAGLLGRMVDGERDVTATLPGIRLDLSPRDGLNAFSAEVTQLTQQLVIMILPVGGLVLYFVTLVAGLLVSRQVQEDVVLSSRGMSRMSILGLHAQMWLLLAGAAFAIGLALCSFVVQLVGHTTSFLRFDDTTSFLTLVFTPQVLTAGAITGLLAASSGLFLAWRSSGQTITAFKQTSGRASRAWWQRMYLDILLLIPAVYVLYTLWQQGGLKTTAENPFSDPLTFVGPTLFSFGLTLLFLRLWPFLLRLASRFISYGRGIALLMALRELTRSISRYRGTLLMMCFTLSLTGFTASMASTLDRSLKDTVDYKTGADVVIVTAADAQTDSSTDSSSGQTTYTVTGYNTLPADDLLKVDGVEQVSRIGRYPGQIVLASSRIQGTILGIDRAAIAAVARFRPDYAQSTLAELVNRLAGNRTGVILSEKTALAYNLRIGQQIKMQVNALGAWYESTVPIVGLIDYFPTLDPSVGFFLLTNIDPIFETVGTNLPYDLWLSLKPGADIAQIRKDVSALGYPIIDWLDPQVALRAAQAEPSRRGVLGFLSIGFVASILLTLVGAVIQSSASFRAQALQLGSLRAMGLGSGSVGSYLILLQSIAAGSGILSGTSIGVATTLLFLPLLDFSGGLPPYLVRVTWGDITTVYVAFAVVLFTVSLLTALFLGRERLSSIVKLGDA